MIRLGLRLTVAGGREAIGRLVLIVVAVAVGVALLFGTLAGLNGVQTQNDRYAWLETGAVGSDAPAQAQPGGNELWWRLRADLFSGKTIGRLDLAATGPHAPLPPGIAALPGPGQYYASPALSRLLHRTPRDELGARYPGTEIGTIGSSALPSPDSLIIVIGRTPAELEHLPGARLVNRISTTVPSDCSGDCLVGVGTNKNGLILILSVVAAALLFPVLILIGGATRLSAARREQRFAAMRLVGATPRQVAAIATVESAVATVVGVAAGFGLFFALRPALARIPFTGERFFPSDLSLTLADVLLGVVGIPIAAVAVARLALRRVTISPLGVTRRVSPTPPSPLRLLPLLGGVVELGYFAYFRDIGASSHTNTTLEAVVFLAGVLLMMAGLVIAGPWLTMLASRFVIRRANRPATLIAARRLADDPKAGFRAISGLVLAVFVGTCASGIITTIVAYSGDSGTASATAGSALIDQLGGPPPDRTPTSIPAATLTRLTSLPGVTGVAAIHLEPQPVPAPVRHQQSTLLPPPVADVVSCAQLAGVPALGRCQPGASAALITPDYGGSFLQRSSMAKRVWPAADVDATQLQHLHIDSIVVGTDGSAAANERARTVLDVSYPGIFAAQTIGEIHADNTRLLSDYTRLAEVVILTSLPIAGCSLAVSIAAGLADRRRPFSLLRLSGTPLRVLRRVIGLEAAAPMLVTAAASIGAGLLAAHLFLRAQLRETLHAPGPAYYVVIAAGLLASLAVIASTLPLLNRATGPEIARND